MSLCVRAFMCFTLVILGIFSRSAEAENQNISCVQVNDDARIALNIEQAIPVLIKGRRDICELGFEYLPDPGQMFAGVLLAAPSELGLRTTNTVYRISFQAGSAVYIGDLPVSAERTSEGEFVDVFQEGGSVFLDRYILVSTAVARQPITLELVFDGRLCVQLKDEVWRMDISPKKSCSRTAKASFKRPICLIHQKGQSRLARRSACKALEDRWPAR